MEKTNKDGVGNLNSSGTTEAIKPISYTPEEMKVRSELIKACTSARDERERPHNEFDGATYSQNYDTNKKADMSFIPPKLNKDDKRIVTGITREKDNTLLSALLSFNFKADITAYDNTEMIFPQLGNNMEDLVVKSRELEQWEKLRPLLYRELIAQGDVFWEDIWECVYTPEFENESKWKPGMKISEAKFKKNLVPNKFERAAVKLHPGKNVYVSNFFEMDHKKQGTVFTYEVMDRDVAQAIYGKWDRWDSVPYQVDNTTVPVENNDGTYGDWNLISVNKDQVGVLKIQQKFANRYMIMLNGVMMLPYNFPLSEVSPDGECTIKHNVLEGIVGCAYGKGQPAKTKVDQAVHDEFLKLLIIGEEQSRKPPMGTRSKRVFGPNIFSPGKINNNMKEGDLFSILPPNSGLNAADFSMYQLIKTMIDDKTINATFSGEQPSTQVTATQVASERQQQLLKLGLNFDAIKSLEKELCWARIGNLIMHYSKPVDSKADKDNQTIEDIYAQFSMETTLPDGRKGIKMFKFTDKDFPEVQEQIAQEDELTDYYQKPVRLVYFNGPEFIKLLKYRWVINITPTQDTNDQIESELFVGKIKSAQEIFGPESLNYEYLKERYALNAKEDPSKFFLDDGGQGVMNNLQASAMVGSQNGGGGSPMASNMSNNVIKPPQIKPVR
jgi:hypothetical protein